MFCRKGDAKIGHDKIKSLFFFLPAMLAACVLPMESKIWTSSLSSVSSAFMACLGFFIPRTLQTSLAMNHTSPSFSTVIGQVRSRCSAFALHLSVVNDSADFAGSFFHRYQALLMHLIHLPAPECRKCPLRRTTLRRLGRAFSLVVSRHS